MPRRGLVVAALLLLALGVAVVLALQAYGVARYHQAQADRVLRDYAALAAARVAQRAGQELYYSAFTPALKALVRARPVLPGPDRLRAGVEDHARWLLTHARYTFRLDLGSWSLATSGAAPAPQVKRWLADTLAAHVRAVYDTEYQLAAVLATVGGEPRAVVYTVVHDTVLGFDANPEGLARYFGYATEKFPLLPRPLTGGVQYDSMGSVIVADAQGHELFRSPVQYATTFAAQDSVGATFGGLVVQVALRPELADKLIIGGLPRSRLPLLLGLLGLTAALIGTALYQLRREYELARLRSDFVSGVSHELRTPLAQIRMFSETLVLGRVRSDDERRRSLEIIDQEARRLTHIVENLLHFSRAERQVARVTPEPTALAPLIEGVVEGFAPLAAAHDSRVAAQVPEGLVAPADPGALRQMLLNLLDNAVKYGPHGQTITVGAGPAGPSGDGAPGGTRLWVDDCGPGIPAADRERVWERFWRLERDRGSAVAGSGIGLAVVRELAALHHGRAWVEDAAGGGSRFVIELPA